MPLDVDLEFMHYSEVPLRSFKLHRAPYLAASYRAYNHILRFGFNNSWYYIILFEIHKHETKLTFCVSSTNKMGDYHPLCKITG